MKRVVVTGLGLVTPLAGNVNTSWKRLIGSESGIEKIYGFETEDLPAKIAGHVPDAESKEGFDPNRCLEIKEQRKAKSKYYLYYKCDSADKRFINI